MSIRALKCGAAGAVVDGYSRDTRQSFGLQFPTFSYGSCAQDQGSCGKVLDYRVPIQIGGVRVSSGDTLFGDMEGVCVVPKVVEWDVMVQAFEKARQEKTARKAL